MSEINQTQVASVVKKEATSEEIDWAAAKAHFENLKSTKPRPVSIQQLSSYKAMCSYCTRLATGSFDNRCFRTCLLTAQAEICSYYRSFFPDLV